MQFDINLRNKYWNVFQLKRIKACIKLLIFFYARYPSSKKLAWKKISYTKHHPVSDRPITFSFSILVQNSREYGKELVFPEEPHSLFSYNSKICGNPASRKKKRTTPKKLFGEKKKNLKYQKRIASVSGTQYGKSLFKCISTISE